MNRINKIAIAVVKNNKLLLVKKKGIDKLITPGGKIEGRESPQECIKRELKEELNATVDEKSLNFLGRFEDISAESKDIIVVIDLYSGSISGELKPQQEIESYHWFAAADDENLLSSIIKNKILPFLLENGYLN
jgi:8-oxo-dGTP diphosphatase